MIVAEMERLSVQRKNNLNAIETSGEPELIRRSSMPVTMAMPTLGFVLMATFAPSFELLEEDVVELREGFTTVQRLHKIRNQFDLIALHD